MISFVYAEEKGFTKNIMDRKEVWITTFAVVNQSLLKQSEHPGDSQNAMTVWTLSNHSQCCSLSLALRAGHYVDSPHSLTLWKWLIAQRGADTVVWWMADANHKFCCVVTPQSALLPQSCMYSHTFTCWLLKEYILWRENCFSGKIEIKKNFQICQTNVVA